MQEYAKECNWSYKNIVPEQFTFVGVEYTSYKISVKCYLKIEAFNIKRRKVNAWE